MMTTLQPVARGISHPYQCLNSNEVIYDYCLHNDHMRVLSYEWLFHDVILLNTDIVLDKTRSVGGTCT